MKTCAVYRELLEELVSYYDTFTGPSPGHEYQWTDFIERVEDALEADALETGE